jgi:hypothetical protein
MDIKFKRNTMGPLDHATASKDISSIAGVSEFEVMRGGVSEDDLSVGGTIS